MTLLIAEGGSFQFHVVAETEAQAREALERGFRKHLRQCRVPIISTDDALTINVINDVKLGVVYRDYEAV